jgi:tetratricopeptide (TPR) repeat protein
MPSAATQAVRSRVETEVLRIRGLLEQQQFAQALASAQTLRLQVPQNRDVLYMLAVSQRFLGRIPEALETLAYFEQVHPGYSRLYQERGHCHLAAREPHAALEAFLQAVRINPALPASWKALEVLFRAAGQEQESRTAAEHVARLASLPVAVVTATAMFADGELLEAERVVRNFLLTHGDHIEAMRLLARIGISLDVLDDAEVLLQGVLAFAPTYDLARYEYVTVLLKLHRYVTALEEIDKLLQSEPHNRAYRICHANARAGIGDQAGALQIFQQLLDEAPAAADIRLSIAHTLKTLGRQGEAIEHYRAAAQARIDFGDAYWSLANLKTYRFSEEEFQRMRALEAEPATALADRYHLCFALGKALEDRSEYAESFRYYERGNALKKSELRFSIEPIERTAQEQRLVCTAPFLAEREGLGCLRADPIFIVGLPRSGSTLIEQILASHSQVEGTMELAEIPRLVQQLAGREQHDRPSRYPAALAQLDAGDFRRFGEKYLQDTQVYRSGKPFFIDKMPNNFRHIGLMHLILPNAKIIDARREPMACCFSNFKQLFASGQEFTYSLEDIARYYRCYVKLMQHWDAVLPGRVLRIQHEQVVEDLEANVRRLLEFCGLEFEPQCLEFYKTERSIRTASSEQVRQPIFREGLEQWRHFEPWLEPLRRALGDLATA